MSKPPLEGVRILSLAEQYPGPYATLLLADMGADVIIVERPGQGDPARQFPPFFNALNRNKRGAAFDLKAPDGRDAFLLAARDTDVILDGFRPGKLASLGVGYDDIAKINPRIIYASITGYGQDGPYRDRAGHDLSYQGIAGFLADQAASGTPGPVPTLPFADIGAALFTTIAVLSALNARYATGEGTYIDVSMSDCLTSMLTIFLAPEANGSPLGDFINEPAYGAFSCADGSLLTLSIAHEDWFWGPLCDALDKPNLRHMGRPERMKNCDSLKREIGAALKRRTRDEWAKLFDPLGVPWGPVNEYADVIHDPHLLARNMFKKFRRPDNSMEWHVPQPLKFRGFETQIQRSAPGLGEHTDEIMNAAPRRRNQKNTD